VSGIHLRCTCRYIH